MKNFHIGLLPRIIIAIILGILFGNFLPASLVRLFVTFNAIFSEFLNFSIPLIIVGLVTIAIADIGKGAGRMLVVTALIAYGATLFSGFLSYFTGMAVFPSLIETGVPLEEVSESQGILPYFSVGIPPLMNVMTALVLAFTLGLGLAHLKSEVLKNAARDFQEIVIRMISAVILPLLPIYIFGIFLNMTHSGQVFGILMVFIKTIGVIFLLHIFLLVFQYSIAALFVRKNPLKLLGRMMPAYFTALGTSLDCYVEGGKIMTAESECGLHQDPNKCKEVMREMLGGYDSDIHKLNWWKFDDAREYLEWTILPSETVGFDGIHRGGILKPNQVLLAQGVQEDELRARYSGFTMILYGIAFLSIIINLLIAVHENMVTERKLHECTRDV